MMKQITLIYQINIMKAELKKKILSTVDCSYRFIEDHLKNCLVSEIQLEVQIAFHWRIIIEMVHY